MQNQSKTPEFVQTAQKRIVNISKNAIFTNGIFFLIIKSQDVKTITHKTRKESYYGLQKDRTGHPGSCRWK